MPNILKTPPTNDKKDNNESACVLRGQSSKNKVGGEL